MLAQTELFEKLFEQSFAESGCRETLEAIVKKYPYFAPAHFFLLKKMDEADQDFQNQLGKTALFFNNPYWLHHQLNEKEIVSTKKEPVEIKKNDSPASTKDEILLFEPLFATDYFASQGIKIIDETNPTDKLGKQLKSFTDWLKTMKKIHTVRENIPDQSPDEGIQKLAEKSNSEEEIVTEAMAEVFIKQGKPAKATEIYKKLSLLIPTKSAYFAGKIEQLKEA